MSLHTPLDGGSITQRFGPSSLSIEPAMYYAATRKAYWQWFPGSAFSNDVHGGVDFAGKPAGTRLLAAETGVVTRSYYDSMNGGGNVVEVEIRPGVRYSYNHCQTRLVGVGHKVIRGQPIATVGATGTIWTGTQYIRSAYGVHVHASLTIVEKGSDGVTRTMLYDFADFMYGGANAGDTRVKPMGASTSGTFPKVVVKPDVNIRTSANLDVGATNIAYTSKAHGIYTYPRGVKVAAAGTSFQLRGHVTTDDGRWGHLYKFDRHLYVKEGLYK